MLRFLKKNKPKHTGLKTGRTILLSSSSPAPLPPYSCNSGQRDRADREGLQRMPVGAQRLITLALACET